MNPLPIDKALQLYKILAPYLPDEVEDDFNFIGTIIDNIKNSGNHRAYVDAVMLMTETDFDHIKTLNSMQVLNLFSQGLAENNILALEDFCKKVGFNA